MIAAVDRLAAVFPVAEKGPSCVCHLNTDLMGSTGQKPTFHQGKPAAGHKNPIFGDGASGARLRLGLDKDLVFDRVLKKFILQTAFIGLRPSADRAEIVFFDLPVANFLVQNTECFGILGGNDDAAGVSVDAVAEGGGKGMLLLRTPFTLLRQIGLNVGNQGVVVPFAGTVTEHTGLLIGEKDVLILV